jgi:hypothetical protein
MLLIGIFLIVAVVVSAKIDNHSIKDAEREFCNIECK